MAPVKRTSRQIEKQFWLLSTFCCLYLTLSISGEPIPVVGVETCVARGSCSENCPFNHTCCACSQCSDTFFPFARSFCFCCPPNHVCCPQTRRGGNPTCCPSGTVCWQTNGLNVCVAPGNPETLQPDWPKVIPNICASDEEVTNPSEGVTMETSMTEMSVTDTDSAEEGTEKAPVNIEQRESSSDDGSEWTTVLISAESENSETPTIISESSDVPDVTTGLNADLMTTNSDVDQGSTTSNSQEPHSTDGLVTEKLEEKNITKPDVDQTSLSPDVTSDSVSNSEESHTLTSLDGSVTSKLEEKNTTVVTEVSSSKGDVEATTEEPMGSHTAEAFETTPAPPGAPV